MSNKSLLAFGTVIVVVIAILAALFLKDRVAPGSAPDELSKVSLGLSWVHQAQFSGEYYADQNGLFREAGIDITLIPASIDKDPIEDLVSGRIDFVIGQPDSLIIAYSRGAKIKAIAATHRIHPMVLSSLPDEGITIPADLVGKTVGVAYSEELILKAMLKNQGIDVDDVSIVKRDYNFTNLVSGKLDVQAAWITDEIQRAKRDGLELYNILPSDYGVHFYADLILTTEELIRENPQLVQRFLTAILHGWRKVISNPKEFAKLTLHYDSRLDLEHEINVLESSIPLIHTGERSIGWMKREDWVNMYQTMVDQGIISTVFDPEELYTMQFLEK
ncbi:MAG: ABC transporter substrate-binding protein [Gammaproteobacteria bacterium]